MLLYYFLNIGVSIPVEDVRHRGHWVKEFWTCHNITEIQVFIDSEHLCLHVMLKTVKLLRITIYLVTFNMIVKMSSKSLHLQLVSLTNK